MNLLRKWFIFGAPAAQILRSEDSFLTRVPPTSDFLAVNQLPLNRTKYKSFTQLESEIMSGPSADRLLCTITPNRVRLTNGCYDRAPTVVCSLWELNPGDVFTSLAFLKYDYGADPSSQSEETRGCPIEPWLDSKLPSRGFPMHTELFLFSEAITPHSTQSCYSTEIPIASGTSLSAAIAQRIFTLLIGPPSITTRSDEGLTVVFGNICSSNTSEASTTTTTITTTTATTTSVRDRLAVREAVSLLQRQSSRVSDTHQSARISKARLLIAVFGMLSIALAGLAHVGRQRRRRGYEQPPNIGMHLVHL